MTDRQTFEIDDQVLTDQEIYQQLIRGSSAISTSFGVIVRSKSVKLSAMARGLLAELDPYLLRVEEVEEWPGTRLIGGRTSRRLLYRVTPQSITSALAVSKGLWDWVNPHLPEDLHLLRGDGTTILGTVAQEKLAWLELTLPEIAELARASSGKLPEALGFVD